MESGAEQADNLPLNAQMQLKKMYTVDLKYFPFPVVEITEGTNREQRTPHPTTEEKGFRAGGGEEDPISIGCGTK